jgi:succinate dehydrogenase / fumarate reductase cytochrome b subunit
MGTAHLRFKYIFSAPGKKFMMGITGLVWAGFVLAHMAGNLLLFISADAYNTYGHLLASSNFIYIAEAVLILSLLVHIVCAVSLTIENKKARGNSRYAMTPSGSKGVSLASKTMAVHGSIILIFIITHLIAFKFGTYYETNVNGVVMRDLHRLVVEVFSNPLVVGWYTLALILLGFHLSHGFGSIFQSLGLRTRTNAAKLNKLSWTYAVIVASGFLAQPLYVFLTR